MSNFEEKIFVYLTQRNNFRTAYEISEQLNEVKSKMIADFWVKVFYILKDLCNGTYFTPGLVYERDHLHIISPQKWGNSLSVYYRNLDSSPEILIWIEPKDGGFDRDRIYDEFKEKEPFKSLDEFKRNEIGWTLGKQKAWDSFDNISSLEKILPDTNEATARIYAERLLEFARSFDESLMQINTMRK